MVTLGQSILEGILDIDDEIDSEALFDGLLALAKVKKMEIRDRKMDLYFPKWNEPDSNPPGKMEQDLFDMLLKKAKIWRLHDHHPIFYLDHMNNVDIGITGGDLEIKSTTNKPFICNKCKFLEGPSIEGSGAYFTNCNIFKYCGVNMDNSGKNTWDNPVKFENCKFRGYISKEPLSICLNGPCVVDLIKNKDVANQDPEQIFGIKNCSGIVEIKLSSKRHNLHAMNFYNFKPRIGRYDKVENYHKCPANPNWWYSIYPYSYKEIMA